MIKRYSGINCDKSTFLVGPPTDVTEELHNVNVTNSTTGQSTCSLLSARDNVSSLNLSSNALSPEAHKLLTELKFTIIHCATPVDVLLLAIGKIEDNQHLKKKLIIPG